ncbi:MurR/RpiR family transcriptional regulator [Oceanobacillus neutriphilus]|uniref:HTH-type transcriptional regulator n=1 Tax=Oceanobacillus neutriphilus TaxID=531815 RepID=A0ABQ2NT21_9BACI|nr:MurR/RpiR family transcriptional regulator [Oceanobacillus neutriphilus]GGP10168.1 putative HTH-type transcriptional regulator [Oceanobacillus neutriphilus]
MKSFKHRIQEKRKSLTNTEHKIIHQLEIHKKPFLLSMNELAGLSLVSEPSVVRLYRKLGYNSYQELKVALAQEQGDYQQANPAQVDILPEDDIGTMFEKIGQQYFQAMKLTKAKMNEKKIYEAVGRLISANQIYFIGQGLSGTVAEDCAHKFMRLGGKAIAVKDPHYQAIYASHMSEGDVVIAISHSGETIDTIHVSEMAKNNGAFLIVITSNENVSLAGMADCLLLTQANETNRQSDAMVSRLIQLTMMDTLYTKMSAMLGEEGKRQINLSRLAVTRMKK